MRARHRVILLFLLPLLFQGLGGFLLFQQEQRTVRATAEQKKQHSETSTIQLRVSMAEFERMRVEKNEIRIDEQMYDIVSMRENDGFVDLVVFPDHEESKLLQKIARVLGQQEHSSGHPLPGFPLHGFLAPFEVPEAPSLQFLDRATVPVRNFQAHLPGAQHRPDALFPPPLQVFFQV